MVTLRQQAAATRRCRRASSYHSYLPRRMLMFDNIIRLYYAMPLIECCFCRCRVDAPLRFMYANARHQSAPMRHDMPLQMARRRCPFSRAARLMLALRAAYDA